VLAIGRHTVTSMAAAAAGRLRADGVIRRCSRLPGRRRSGTHGDTPGYCYEIVHTLDVLAARLARDLLGRDVDIVGDHGSDAVNFR
jgi:hypothetical protein